VKRDVLYVDDGDVATSAGVAAGLDLCLHLVRNDYGADIARQLARALVLPPHRDGRHAQLLDRPMPAPQASLVDTCDWALRHLEQPLTVADLARHAGWAPRTFARRFRAEIGTTPLRWLTTQRIAEARRLLELSDLPVESIARHCGLGTATNLRLHLAKETGDTPTSYRHSRRPSALATGTAANAHSLGFLGSSESNTVYE